jgi:C4-dicarboxylate-specific signal transduction histidine kinase
VTFLDTILLTALSISLALHIYRHRQVVGMRRRFQILVDSVPCTISWVDSNQVYLEANESLLTMLRVDRKAFIGRQVGFMGGDPEYLKFVENIFNRPESQSTFEFTVNTPQGSKTILSIAQRYMNNTEAAIIGIDVTELKEKERIILEQEQTLIDRHKLASLGLMAGSISHEINNPLAIIMMTAQRVRMLASDPSKQNEVIQSATKIEATSQRIAKIIKSLLAIARESSTVTYAAIPMKAIVEDALTVCSQKIENHLIELRLTLPRDSGPMVECNVTQMGQLILNLIENAIHAVEPLEEKWIHIEIKQSESWVRLEIKDSGPGIPPVVAAKIFDPFFTTKPIGKGTGLGLSISRSIVEKHNGLLFIDQTQPNTCFVIELQRVEVSPQLQSA